MPRAHTSRRCARREGRRRYESACGPTDAPSGDGLAAKARGGFRGGALAALRRQAAQYEFEVVHDHRAHAVPNLRDVARAVRGEQSVERTASAVARGNRFFGEDIDGDSYAPA